MSDYDVIVIGTGIAGCTAALRARKGGLKVLAIEKSQYVGGTSAMSGAGLWVPGNHIAKAEGINDSTDEAISYIRSAVGEEEFIKDEARLRSYLTTTPAAFKFICDNTNIVFKLLDEPDPYVESNGSKKYGRMLSTMPLRRSLLSPLEGRLRPSTIPHFFSYQENVKYNIYHKTITALIKISPQIIWRFLTNQRAQGSALMTGIINACISSGVTFMLNRRVERLVCDDNGRVTGVEVTSNGVKQVIKATRGVILASGGFEWNKDMLGEHFKGPLDRLGSPSTNEGDGHKMALAVGAQLDKMGHANVSHSLPGKYEGKRYGIPINFLYEPHSILVNRNAKRFISEAILNSAEGVDARNPDGSPVNLPCYLVGDHRFLGESFTFRWFAAKDRKWVVKANSIPELATKLGLPEKELVATINRWNEFCKKGRDEDFHRGETYWEMKKDGGSEGKIRLMPIDKPPYIGMSVNRSLIGTKGGPRTNEFAQVLRADNSVIPGLYACGLVMSNPIGIRAVGSGTTLAPNMTWGYIAAEKILKS